MNEAPIHRLYLHFQELPASLRVLYTGTLAVLSIGYLFAIVHIYNSHAGRDGDAMLSPQDLVIAYGGSDQATQLETALKGPMAGMLPAEERAELIAWARSGATEEAFTSQAQPIIENRCLQCHNGSNPHVPDLSSYSHVSQVVQLDEGMDFFSLVRVSHTHLLGITFMFFIVGLIFSHAYVRPVWFKCVVVGLPFLAIAMDILCWYMTKLIPGFAWVVMGTGAMMGGCFGLMVLVSVYQMWFYKMPPELVSRDAASRRAIG
jgi:hypothetical protein